MCELTLTEVVSQHLSCLEKQNADDKCLLSCTLNVLSDRGVRTGLCSAWGPYVTCWLLIMEAKTSDSTMWDQVHKHTSGDEAWLNISQLNPRITQVRVQCCQEKHQSQQHNKEQTLFYAACPNVTDAMNKFLSWICEMSGFHCFSLLSMYFNRLVVCEQT